MVKLLLTGVFKPFGVSDEYGEALCTMELLNNQVTREQGIHSPRSNNLSFGLYLMAENLDIPATVLDFPSWNDFRSELLNNQVTREQGIHSPRSNNLSFGLYLMAENLDIPATVLDFPSWNDFTKEIKTFAKILI